MENVHPQAKGNWKEKKKQPKAKITMRKQEKNIKVDAHRWASASSTEFYYAILIEAAGWSELI